MGIDADNIGLVIMAIQIALGFYVYFAYCLQVIAQKTGTKHAWMAWVPIANLVLALAIADLQWWWVLLWLIPFASPFVAIVVFMEIAQKRGKPSWIGVLVIVPVVNLVVPGYLAFSD